MLATLLAVTLPTFDISFVVEQLMDKPEFKAWTPERFSEAVDGYRNYLALHKNEPEVSHPVPSKDVDEIWHRHILNTKRYFADCQTYFGHYLHHTPFPAKAGCCGDTGCGSSDCTGGCE